MQDGPYWQERQNAASGLAEEQIAQGIKACSHNENHCARFENGWQASNAGRAGSNSPDVTLR